MTTADITSVAAYQTYVEVSDNAPGLWKPYCGLIHVVLTPAAWCSPSSACASSLWPAVEETHTLPDHHYPPNDIMPVLLSSTVCPPVCLSVCAPLPQG